MRRALNYIPAWAAMILLPVLLYIMYPYFRYCLQADTVAYLTIARRYAAGDVDKAINGFWSPWSCWLVSVLIKGGFAPIPSAIVVNSMGAIGVIGITQSLFLKFGLKRYFQWALNGSLAVFLCYAVYRQWFADVWQAFFLLCTLRLLVAERYMKNPVLWILCGLLAGLAYFARAYSLPFFILQVVCCGFLLVLVHRPSIGINRWIISSATAIIVMGAFSSLWIWQLYKKYHIWTFSTAGHMNLSWSVMGKQYWQDEYQYLVPPVYNNSPHLWEDPSIAGKLVLESGGFISFLSSTVVYIGANLLRLVSYMNTLSFFFLLIIGFSIALLSSPKVRGYFPRRLVVVACSLLLFPIGNLLITSEKRYLWYLVPLSMLACGLLLQRVLPLIEKKWLRDSIVVLFAISYICNPVMSMKEMFRNGQADSILADEIKKKAIGGTFTSNANTHEQELTVIRLAYHTGRLFYYHQVNEPAYPQLLAAMRKHKVKYYFHFHRYADNGYVMKDEQGMPFPEIDMGIKSNFKIFLVNP